MARTIVDWVPSIEKVRMVKAYQSNAAAYKTRDRSGSKISTVTLPGLFTTLLLLPLMARAGDLASRVNYGRDVRPILSENCFYCHGQDANKRKAKLQFNTQEGQRTGEVILPGQPDKS